MKNKMKRLLGILLSLVLVLGLMPGMSLTAYADTPTAVKYLDANGVEQSCSDYTVVSSSSGSVSWSSGWYVVKDDVTISIEGDFDDFRLNGNVNLILCDDACLTVSGGKRFSGIRTGNYSLTIYAQSTGDRMGKLIANTGRRGIYSTGGKVSIIGGNVDVNSIYSQGELSICGGSVTATVTGSSSGSAIEASGRITISGGTVKATGGYNSAISTSTGVTISGGTVTAIDTSQNARGINCNRSSRDVTISGGKVTAIGDAGGINAATVKNAIAGTGWTNTEGTEGKADIAINETGQDLSSYKKVQFPPDIAVTGVSLDRTTTQTIDVDNKVSFTASVSPDNASDKTVKWSVGGTDATAVKLYSDENCSTEVGKDATETLTVYAKGMSAGNATVTCTSNEDSAKSASCDVMVNAVASYPLWVGGVQVTSANKDDVLGDTDEGATVSYDVDTNTLTLNGVDIAAGYTEPIYNSTSGIYYSGNDSLSIVLSEDSDNKVGVSGNVQIGINSSSYITISGAGKLTVKGYSVGIEAYALTIKDAEINVEGAYNGIQTKKYGYGVNIISGKVNATGKTGTGIHSGMDVNWKTKSAVTVGENATVVAIGGNKAIDYLKNAIAGTGWTDPEDNTSKTTISINSEGQSIDTLKKMAFPELPASTVTTAPEANDLIFTGSAQELVTAGVTSDGEMQYALGTDATTAPTSDWGTFIPTKTDVGT